MTIAGPKSSLRDILLSEFLVDDNQSEVNLRKISRTFKLIKEIINAGQRILVLSGHLVQLVITNAKSK